MVVGMRNHPQDPGSGVMAFVERADLLLWERWNNKFLLLSF
jgi:hypothetical protein